MEEVYRKSKGCVVCGGGVVSAAFRLHMIKV